MNANTIKHMQQHFLGKVCSIITTSMNRAFDESISRRHFVVVIQDISADGIWGCDPGYSESISFFAMSQIISIHQEIELDPSNPEHAAMIKEYEKKTGKKLKSDILKFEKPEPKKELEVIEKTPVLEAEEASKTGDATFIDIESLERLAEHTKRSFDAYKNFSLTKH